MIPEHQKWLRQLGAELRKRLETEELAPEEIDLLLGKLREIEAALSKVTFISDSGDGDELNGVAGRNLTPSNAVLLGARHPRNFAP